MYPNIAHNIIIHHHINNILVYESNIISHLFLHHNFHGIGSSNHLSKSSIHLDLRRDNNPYIQKKKNPNIGIHHTIIKL